MLLNKIPVLDKGFVALIDSCNTTKKLREVGVEFFKNGDYPLALENMGTLTLAIKCPLFVQLSLSKHNLTIVSSNIEKELDAYVPKSHEISSSDRLLNDSIADSISKTTEALIINSKAYAADGADKFISQILMPINVYTTIIVHGSYTEWCNYAYKDKTPSIINAYSSAIGQIIEAEWS